MTAPTAPAVRRCEARIGSRLGEWSSLPVLCQQSEGVRPIVDATGTVRGACSIGGHEASVVHRFGRYAGELAALDAHAEGVPWDPDEARTGSRCCGAGGSTPHWVECPERIPELELRALFGDR